MGALTHQYTFNDGAGTDSQGSADATLVDSGAAFGRAQLGGTAGYVDLPGATIGYDSYTAVSFEMWMSYTGAGNWERGWDFGTTNPNDANAGWQYLFLAPDNGGGISRLSISNAVDDGNGGLANNENNIDDDILVRGPEHHVVGVYDDANDMMHLYVDGGLVGSNAMTHTLSGVSTQSAWLGRSHYANDSFLQGAINEFRIYDHALSAQEVADNFAAGPTDDVGGPTLTINRDSGEMVFSNPGASEQMVQYTITSGAGALDLNGWVPITNNKDAGGDGSFDSDGNWRIEPAATVNQISELEDFIDGGALGSVSLGNAWRKWINEDIVGTFSILDTVTFQTTTVVPEIIWEGNGGVPFERSDFDFDGDIDGDDYAVLRDNNNVAIDAMLDDIASYAFGDLNGDQINNVVDFRIFKGDYTAANGQAAWASLTGVPEPGTVCLMAVGAGLALCVHRRRR